MNLPSLSMVHPLIEGEAIRGPLEGTRQVELVRPRQDPEPQGARHVTPSARDRDLPQHAARRGRRVVTPHLQVAAALNARRGARLPLDDRRRPHIDWPLRRSPRQLTRQLLGEPNLLPELALQRTFLAAEARQARHEISYRTSAPARRQVPSPVFGRGSG